MSHISIHNVHHSFDASHAVLAGVSFDVEPGSFCGIIGPNGSGKTTLLKCISGELHPQTGEVLLDGRSVSAMPARDIARRMALVQQHTSLDYDFTVADIVLMGRNPYLKRWQGETQDDYALMNDALKTAGIAHLKDRLITTLSGGEWQMMVLARALCQQADVMLLDEPVTGLDIRHQVSIMETVSRLAKGRGLSVVCVLHDLNLALHYCDRLVLLGQGQICAQGAPDEVLTRENIRCVYGTDVHMIVKDGQTFIQPVMG